MTTSIPGAIIQLIKQLSEDSAFYKQEYECQLEINSILREENKTLYHTNQELYRKAEKYKRKYKKLITNTGYDSVAQQLLKKEPEETLWEE